MSEQSLLVLALAVFFIAVFLWGRQSRVDAPRSSRSEPKKASAVAATSLRASVSDESPALPKIGFEDDVDLDPTKVGDLESKRVSLQPPTNKIVYDEDAAVDEPTQSRELILVTATGQTDKGIRRKKNEDAVLALEDHNLFVVADGMGGYHGGEIASSLAVETIQRAFQSGIFPGPEHDAIPRRASELARAIQAANEAILERAEKDKLLEGMGTTICAARFSPNKQRLYVGHVGDSRIYRMRGGRLRQMTSDHTMKDLGVTGEGASHLSRAVGVWPTVPIDILLGKPQPGDLYLLCSDGLSKMVSDDEIARILFAAGTPEQAVDDLIQAANANGGKDNVSVVVVRIDHPAMKNRPPAAA